MLDVSAAIKNNAKNMLANNMPPGIWWNTTGSVTNTSPGPSDGSLPNANNAGKIAKPATMAINVSMKATCRLAMGRLCSGVR